MSSSSQLRGQQSHQVADQSDAAGTAAVASSSMTSILIKWVPVAIVVIGLAYFVYRYKTECDRVKADLSASETKVKELSEKNIFLEAHVKELSQKVADMETAIKRLNDEQESKLNKLKQKHNSLKQQFNQRNEILQPRAYDSKRSTQSTLLETPNH